MLNSCFMIFRNVSLGQIHILTENVSVIVNTFETLFYPLTKMNVYIITKYITHTTLMLSLMAESFLCGACLLALILPRADILITQPSTSISKRDIRMLGKD